MRNRVIYRQPGDQRGDGLHADSDTGGEQSRYGDLRVAPAGCCEPADPADPFRRDLLGHDCQVMRLP
jgi:hypothetical protein